MSTVRVPFNVPAKTGGNASKCKIFVSATGNSAANLKVSVGCNGQTLSAASEGARDGKQFLAGALTADFGSEVSIEVSVNADLEIGNQSTFNNDRLTYKLIGANDGGADKDFQDVLIMLSASGDSFDN